MCQEFLHFNNIFSVAKTAVVPKLITDSTSSWSQCCASFMGTDIPQKY